MRTAKYVPIAVLISLAARCWAGEAGGDLQSFLAKIADHDPGVRMAARLAAPQYGAAAVVPLGELIDAKDMETVRTARAALERIVHEAGRPGAFVERPPVVAELAKLLGADRPAAVKREVLYLIACIGDDAAVPPVAARLDDADARVAEAARLSLERIPGKAAVAALLEAARKAPAAAKVELLYSISKKGDATVNLTEFVESPDAAVRLAALEALARLGVAGARPLFAAEFARADGGERGRVVDEYLRLADAVKASHADEAKGIYEEVLAKAPLDHQREHALGALCPAGKLDAMPLLAAALADPSPRLRRLAAVRLDALKGPEARAALEKAYGDAKEGERPAVLRALAERDPAAAKPLVEKAAADPQVELKIVALDVLGRLGDPALEDVLRRTAESGPEWLRPTAIKGYLAIARKKFDMGAKAEALPLFARVLDLAREGGQRMDALRGVIEVGDPKEISRLENLLADPALGAEAARGYVSFAAALGKAGDKEAAEKHLMKVVTGEFPRDLKTKAGEELNALGLDPRRPAKVQGFVVDWFVVTPIANTDGKGMEAQLFPEKEIRLHEQQKVGPRRFVWQKVGVSLDGVIDLIPLFRRSENVITYAYTELESSKEQDVLIKVGSDDGCAVFVNDARVLHHPARREFKVDDETAKAHLVAGKNKVLVKIAQVDGPWQFSLRVTDPDGKPVELPAIVK